MSCAPIHEWCLRIWRDILAVEFLSECRGPSPTLGSRPRAPVPERGAPQHLAVKISRNSVHLGETEGCWQPKHPLKEPMHRLTHLQALAWPAVEKLQLGVEGGTETCRERETELYGSRAQVGGRAPIVPVLVLAPHGQM